MRGKKMLSVLLVGAMAASMAVSVSAADDVQLTDEEITLKFWDIWPEGQPMAPLVQDYIAQYEEEHPNIHIEEIATQEVDYQTTKLRVAAADSSQGDVFFCWGGGYAKTYVDAGVVLPLDEYYEKYGVNDELLQGATTYCTYNDQTYGLPLKQWAGVLFCNKRIFDENNLEIPTTYDEMIECIKVFRENGVTPMVLGAKDGWHIGMIQNMLAVRTAGADYMNSALAGDATLDTPEIVESARLLAEMNEAGAFPEGTLGISSDEAEELFYSGMVPMFFAGSWAAQSVDSPDNACSQDEIVVTTFPSVENGKGDTTQYSGGVIDFFMINNATEHPDEAFDLNEAGAFPEGTLGISSDEAEELFYSGMVPMFFAGSWAAQSVDSPDNACSQDEIVVTTFPSVENGKGDTTQYSGGVIDFFMINNATEHPDEAFDFAYGMTKYMSKEAYILGDSLPCWTDLDTGDADISPSLAKVQELIQDSTGYVLAWDTFLTGSAIDASYNLLQGVIEGSITPEDFASQIEQAKEEALAE